MDCKDICYVFESSLIDGTKPKIKQALNNDTSSANPNVNINVLCLQKIELFNTFIYTLIAENEYILCHLSINM